MGFKKKQAGVLGFSCLGSIGKSQVLEHMMSLRATPAVTTFGFRFWVEESEFGDLEAQVRV